ncbi:MAG: HAMP domain-containing histidine kinase, partial [Bacteroidota bacterium]|nr:HAMP domain-containing histidine kinase [Bacteroidota bacterium]
EITFSSVQGEAGKSVNMNAEACNACHVPGKSPAPPNGRELSRIFISPKGYRVLGLITPIRNEKQCSTADCHAHSPSQTVLGVLDVMLPLAGLDKNLAAEKHAAYMNGLLMLGLMTLFTGVFIWFVVNIPVKNLTRGTQEITKGNLDHRIPVRSKDEIGRLATSFNQMTDEVKRAHDELTQWAQTLEERVAQKTEELRRAQTTMVQMEKMVSLGKLASTVAHELNNPLEGVLTYAKLLKRSVKPGILNEEQASEIQNELSVIADETARCGNVVKNLLLFSRQKVGEFQESDIRSAIENSLKLIDHHLRIHNITLQTSLPDDKLMFFCDIQQIEQALLAIEINAVEAIPDMSGGTLTLSARRNIDAGTIEIRIKDNGIGISGEDLPHIFEPFFTTKENGKGTGLGLAVAYGIIERHDGTIEVRSKLHHGSEFIVTLPVKKADAGSRGTDAGDQSPGVRNRS